jgi:hypothetical protein
MYDFSALIYSIFPLHLVYSGREKICSMMEWMTKVTMTNIDKMCRSISIGNELREKRKKQVVDKTTEYVTRSSIQTPSLTAMNAPETMEPG